ncbi:hypothetical protein HID58_074367 [Brassica napus]|uniref:CCHC-type domain-containing protein n=1 Tax=Brassica napus TaxID=3708 RepID=A0ABQ7YJT0_BRANA|nr:hypothetical protein HID58_074367 [Brassica napus]
MSSEEGRLITFGCYYGGKFEEVDGKDLYNGGGYRIMEAYPSRLFPELMNQLPISLYGQRVWFKFPYEGIEERQLIRNGDDQFTKMCRASVWVDSIDIFVEPETEGDESRAENEREETERYEADSEAERYEAERNEHQFDEEARVERNVADFVDEDFDEYATPLCSDDDEDGVERDGYLRYIKGSGDLKLRQAFESLEAFKKAMVDYVLKHRWNIKMQYQTPIEAVHGVNFWKKTDESVIVPPITEDTDSALGRKKIPKRIKGKNESPSKKKKKVRQESPTKVSREKRIIHCGRCGAVGHNSRKCSSIGVEIQRPPKKNKESSQPMLSQVID